MPHLCTEHIGYSSIISVDFSSHNFDDFIIELLMISDELLYIAYHALLFMTYQLSRHNVYVRSESFISESEFCKDREEIG